MKCCKMKPPEQNKVENLTINTDTSPLQEHKLKIWGSHDEHDFTQIINSSYEEVVHWRKNIFLLPSGASGKKFIAEITRIINLWNNKVPVSRDVAMKIIMIMPALLLQKPTYKSKAKEHSACLTRRLLSWEIGDIDSLIREGRAIQSKLQINRKPQTQEAIAKSFAKLMLSGKVNAAIRLLDKTQPSALLEMNEDTLNDLKEKHPDAKLPDQSVMIEAEAPFVDPIIFNNIDESTISKAALRTKGAAGPSGRMQTVGDEFLYRKTSANMAST